MSEGKAERPGRVPLPHILVPWRAAEQAYKGRAGGAPKPIRQIGDRAGHASRLPASWNLRVTLPRRLSMRAFRFHALPWPRERLRDLFDATVRLRVTLSYFVEPNPSSRGWQGRYRYASHGLRFDVKRPTETLEDFQRRLGNAAAREEGDDAPQPETSADDRWYIGSRLRNTGSLHADIWTGTPNSPTAATSASPRSAAGGKRTTGRIGLTYPSATPSLSPYAPKQLRPTSTPRSPLRLASRYQ